MVYRVSKTNKGNLSDDDITDLMNDDISLDENDVEYEHSDIKALLKDIRKGRRELGMNELRFLVKMYRNIQKGRMRTGSQVGEMTKRNEPNLVIKFFHKREVDIEADLGKILLAYCKKDPVGQWIMSIKGLGGIYAACLLSYLDVTGRPTAGSFWSYAGLDPKRKWLNDTQATEIIDKVVNELLKSDTRPDLGDMEDYFTIIQKRLVELFEKTPDVPKDKVIGKVKRGLKTKIHKIDGNVSDEKIEEAIMKVTEYVTGDDFDADSIGDFTDTHISKIAELSGWSVDFLENHGRSDSGAYTKTSLRKALVVRPFNAELKRLCYLIGDSFILQQNRDGDLYGKLYKQRLEYEKHKSESLQCKEQAYEKMKVVGKTTEAYKKYYSHGKLPPAHIINKARRWTVKIFLSHLHHVMYLNKYGEAPPNPYVIDHLGHAHKIEPPNLEILDKYTEEKAPTINDLLDIAGKWFKGLMSK